MISRNQKIAGLSLALIVASATQAKAFPVFGSKKPKDANAGKKLTPGQSALIDKAVLREKEVIKVVKERTPLVETYIQNMKQDPVMRQVPDSDQHFLGRVDFGKVIGDDAFKQGPKAGSGEKGSKLGFFKNSAGFLGGLGGSLHLQFHEAGFVSMLLMDSYEFDKQHYNFGFVRNDFLGNVPTAVFDVTPAKNNDRGRFFGRIWVETRNGNVVRFNGDFAGSDKEYQDYYHFDSWRTNVQPDLWLPTSFYVEESDPKSRTSTLKFKAINHVWGYQLKVPPVQAENTSLEVVGAQDVSNDAQDVSPLGAQRAFSKQAEDNVVEKLFEAGLIDAPSDFDKTLEALANNILAYNNIPVAGTIHVRTLLTEPLESLSVGNTIILSKSLIDTTAVQSTDGAQQEGNLYAIVAFQLAHILAGHKLDTKYAFNDRLLFPSDSSFKRIPMHHTDADNIEAAKKTMELLSVKELEGGQKYFGLYLQQLQQRVKGLKALNTPAIGDGLVKSETDPTFWLAAMMPKGDKLNVKDLKQQAAEPLSSFLRFDPWTDQVITMHTALEPILSASDKMPFEVAPVYLKLGYYKAPAEPVPSPAGPAPADNTAPAPAPAPTDNTVPAQPTAPTPTPTPTATPQ
ncbi:hypothetical protein [Granulicella tundricola]|uniref:Uncharacterized protein n=1 Tax=Granulicella tundricola (strain ATCC BAA-1859 / DSM 23138 / MP5ACTX9) TaxID=1198114 RepID=E8WXS8_GRATM|nr:hypothetical protein [Granulicella tundricola]ADW69773.1 hypothetical protein AciX9_2749 [Granulicella tundricola MP5ACTX9]